MIISRVLSCSLTEKSTSMEKSAIYNSDVDDSAESSSDEEGPQEIPNIPQEPGNPQGSSSNSGKKFIKMVDRIAESKFFQAATENRYIKKAMEGGFRPSTIFRERLILCF